jgi:hypothetical protein
MKIKNTSEPSLDYRWRRKLDRDLVDGEETGKDPRTLPIETFNDLGHVKTPLLKVIQAKCLDCCCYQRSKIRKCVSSGCALWPYRMGTNPFVKHELSEERRQELSRRMRARSPQTPNTDKEETA